MLRRFLLLGLTLVLVIAGLPFSLAQTECDFSYSNYARAAQLHDMGDYDRALRHYQCARLENPDDRIIPLLIEQVYDDIANASSAWSRPVDEASAACDSGLNHARLGAAAHDAGDDNLALFHLHCALLGDPAQVDALYRTGMIHINRGDTHEAKYYFDRAAAANAVLVEREDLLIVLLGEDARSLLDADALEGSSLKSPEPGETGEYRRGDSPLVDFRRLAETSQEEGTLYTLERAQRDEPTRVDLRCELGRRYMARGDFAAAYGQFTPLIVERLGDHCRSAEPPAATPVAAPAPTDDIKSEPAPISPAEAQFAEGLRYMKAGKLYLAANIFLAALELDPLHLRARCRLGMIYADWAHYRGALEQFDFVLQHDAHNDCARDNRTIAARDMLAIFTPLVVDDYFHYARIYIGMDEWELARDAFLKGLEIDPTRNEVRCELGMLYAQLGDDLAALNEFDLALFADDMDSCAGANRYAVLQRLRDG